MRSSWWYEEESLKILDQFPKPLELYTDPEAIRRQFLSGKVLILEPEADIDDLYYPIQEQLWAEKQGFA